MKLGKGLIKTDTRDRSIDIAKGIGIITVVWGHVPCTNIQGIYLFHMPLFFL